MSSTPDGSAFKRQPHVTMVTAKATGEDMQKWRAALVDAIKALKAATPGSVFLVAVEPVSGSPRIAIGAARNTLTPRQTAALRAAVSHLSIFYTDPATVNYE